MKKRYKAKAQLQHLRGFFLQNSFFSHSNQILFLIENNENKKDKKRM